MIASPLSPWRKCTRLKAHSRRSLIQCVLSMDNGTTGGLAHGSRSIAIVGHATGYLFAELRGYWRTALFGRRLLPLIGASRRGRRERLARALDSLPHLRGQFVPTARSRVVRGRPLWNPSTEIEQPSQGVSSVDIKAPLADQTPLASSLMLWVTRVLIAGLVVVSADSKPNPWSSFLRWVSVGRIAWQMATDAHRWSNRLRASPSATAHSNCEIGTQTQAIGRQFQHSH